LKMVTKMSEQHAGISRTVFAAALIVMLLVGVAGGYVARMMTVPSGQTQTTGITGMTTTVGASSSEVVIGVTDKITDLDPANIWGVFTQEILTNTMEGLLKYIPGTTELQLGIARSYTIEDNGNVYIFKLKPNLRYSDGTLADANNVAWSIKRVMKIGADAAYLVTDYVKDVQALDSETVKFTLKAPASYFPSVVATSEYFTVHPSYNPDKVDSDQTAGGLGEYHITAWQRDVQLVLDANPYYYDGAPKLQRVIIKFYSTASAMRLALESGEIDIAWRTLTPSDVHDLRNNPALQVEDVPGAYIRYVIINENIPPFDNKLVRQAVAAAADRNAICDKIFYGTVHPLYSMIPMGMWSHTDAFKDKYGEHNLDLARSLLKQAGYSETNKLTFDMWYTPSHYGDTEADVALQVKESLESTGIMSVNLKSAEWATYLDQTKAGLYPVSLYGWYPDYFDPDNYQSSWVDTGWIGHAYKNPVVSSLIANASMAQTVQERVTLYAQSQAIWADDSAVIPLFQGGIQSAYKTTVSGVVLDPGMVLRYWLIYYKPT
jgi:peptide/nickel transport system substrate-binding protein